MIGKNNNIADWPVRHPFYSLLIIIAISSIALWGNTKERDRPGISSPKAKSDRELTKNTEKEFGPDGSEILLIVDCTDPDADLYDIKQVEGLTYFLKKLRKLPFISQAFFVDQIPGFRLGFIRSPLFPEIGDADRVRKNCKVRALEHPLIKGKLLSQDAKTAIVPIFLKGNYRSTESKLSKIREVIRDTLAPYSLRARLTGKIPIDVDRREAMKKEQRQFQLIGYALASILALAFFRGIISTLVVGSAPIIGVAWTIGILGFTGESLSPLSKVIMPIILTMIGFTNAAHIVFQYQREQANGKKSHDCMSLSLKKLGMPCFLSALTTSAGFMSLTIAEAKMISNFGRDCAVGSILIFISVILVLPLLKTPKLSAISEKIDSLIALKIRSLFKLQPKKSKVIKSDDLNEISPPRIPSKIIGVIMKRSKSIFIIALIITASSLWSTTSLKPDMFLKNQLPDNSESGKALMDADKIFGGIQAVRVVIQWEDNKTDPIPIIEKVVTAIKSEKLLSEPLSIIDVLNSAPSLGKKTSINNPILKSIPDRYVRPLLRKDLNKAVVITRVQDLGVAKYAPVYDRLESQLDQINKDFPEFKFGLSGGAVGWGRYVYRMVNDLSRSISIAAFIILVMITLAFRSLKIGLVAMLPNLFPLLMCAAVLSLFELPLTLEIICAFTICLGIAADDSIHFLSQFKTERENGHSLDKSLEKSFLHVGKVLVVTTAVMVCGLGSVFLSSLPMYRSFTAVACGTLGAALIADLIILPAILKIFDSRKNI